FALENQKVPRDEIIARIPRVLEAVRLEGTEKRHPHELSGGQKQRLTIASILAMHPGIIVMDEPTAFLDPVGAEKIFEVLKTLNREYGITILLIEHRLDLAVKYCGRIIVFDKGRIVNDGTPREIFTSDETRLIGIGIPRMVELGRRLGQRGYNIGIPLNSDEAFTKLTPFLKKLETTNTKQGLPELDEIVGEYIHAPIIELRDVTYSYSSGINALCGVSLTINKGDFVAIMGENGAGKTTLVKHFNGLLRPKSGNVVVDSEDVSKKSVASMARKVGLVFQNPDDQFFAEDVEEELSFALRNFGYEEAVIKERVEWALNLLDLQRYKKSSPFILSGGERKRVALASILAWNPDVLVLDEPTVGQDHGQKERLKHFLMQLRTQGKTVVIVTHDVEFVAESQPRVVLMSKGRVIADGVTKKIMTDVQSLEACSVAPPEVTKLFSKLTLYGLPGDVLDVDEALDLLTKKLRRDNP
ncbi:MAG: energy-coupling factor transporter ATPase, partial [Candidatus Bathyarchaeota archaeon]|nr:energy-coupling factor transporter ATPase [Candidatus Bathyarchaeota archaeon]